MSKADRAMSDIDAAASPSSISSPNMPDNSAKFIPNINVYGSETPTSTAQDMTTTISYDVGCGDPIALQKKLSVEEQRTLHAKAMTVAKPNSDTTLPSFQSGEMDYDDYN